MYCVSVVTWTGQTVPKGDHIIFSFIFMEPLIRFRTGPKRGPLVPLSFQGHLIDL